MMLTCDGLTDKIECMTEADIYQHALELFKNFNEARAIDALRHLSDTTMTTEQFCQFIGRCRLYMALSESQRKALELPKILLGDTQLNAATRGFVNNTNFGLNGEDAITCWQLLQLLNESVKTSYIDTWADRNLNATSIALGVQRTIRGDGNDFSWFLN